MDSSPAGDKVVVVGAGPVGALAAIYAARRGYQVEVYELRGDLRLPSTTPLNFTKSINLALSERGVNSLRHARHPTLLETVTKDTLPMYGRMIHGRGTDGTLKEESQAYSVVGEAIRAVDRAELNKHILDELEEYPNVKLFFNHKLTGADFDRKLAWFEQNTKNHTGGYERKPEVQVPFTFMIGCDGAHSSVRYHMMKYTRMNYEQTYIDTLWCEFTIPPLQQDFRLSPNHLHIWPGSEFMFIAIPSLDKSFTCTLFASARTFELLSDDHLVEFFDEKFPGVVPNLISVDSLNKQFQANPHLPLISIKCHPYHYSDAAVILGDAAHAMVPFYGQGMNAGLEDVRILFENLDTLPRSQALRQYSAERHEDVTTINDLAMENYQEMRAGVVSPLYLARKRVEEFLAKYVPQLGWQTQYSRISFSNEPYSSVAERSRRQGEILVAAAVIGSIVTISACRLAMHWSRV